MSFSVRVRENSRLQIVCFLCETTFQIQRFHLETVHRQGFGIVVM